MDLVDILAKGSRDSETIIDFATVVSVTASAHPPYCSLRFGGTTQSVPGVRLTTSCPAPTVGQNVVALRYKGDVILLAAFLT